MASIINSDTILVYPDKTKNGYPLHVEYTSIDPGKENVVLLHGYMGSIKDYEFIIKWLSEEYNILAVDLRGHGGSELPEEDFQDKWTIASLAEDIRVVIESILPVDPKVNIVASSLSTAIAMEFANRYPETVDKLFLISPAEVLDIPKWGRLLMQIEKMTPSAITKFLISLTTRLVPAMKFDQENRDTSKTLYKRVRHLNVKSHQKILRETVNSWKIDISSIRHPVLILAGEEDQIVPFTDSMDLNDKLPNSTIVVMENMGHQILYYYPDIVLMILNYWLRAHDKLLAFDHFVVENYNSEHYLPSLLIA